MDNQNTTVGFFEPSEPLHATARYLRTLGGAMMLADREPEQGLATWICGGCGDGSRCGWPLDRPAPSRHTTEDEAWSAAQQQALAHAHTCRIPPRVKGEQTAPVIASRAGGDCGGDENSEREVTVDVDPSLPLVHQPLVQLLKLTCENAVDLVAEYTGTRMPSIRIGVTTWWGMHRWALAEALAVAGRPWQRPSLRVYAACVWDALRYRTNSVATAYPNRSGGVTILFNASALSRHKLNVHRLLLHELRHAAQLAGPAYRAMVVALVRHATWVERRDQEWLDWADQLLDRCEAEAQAAEDWTWAALNARRATEDAAYRAEIDRWAKKDRQEAALGNARTACRWCNDERYVPTDEPGPHSCRSCRYKDGY